MNRLSPQRPGTTPATINNPQQVNLAAEGGQQVNISKDESPQNK
ncbi:MAG: hypothetical protein AB7P14_05525 [Blastocatellales bacterium]